MPRLCRHSQEMFISGCGNVDNILPAQPQGSILNRQNNLMNELTPRNDIGAIPDLQLPSQAIWRPRRIANASYWQK